MASHLRRPRSASRRLAPGEPSAGECPERTSFSFMWMLESAADDDGGRFTFRLLAGAVKTMGRAPRADFIVEAALVSRLHCRLAVTASGQLEVQDLKSTNGTFVNGRRIDKAVLVSGDRLGVGRVEFAVKAV